MNSKKSEKVILFSIKNMKYLKIYLTKYVQELYPGKSKTLLGKI